MNAISAGMGSGQVQHLELDEAIDEDWCEFLTIDLKMQTSKFFLDDSKVEWHCKGGLCSSLPQLNAEFNLYRGLFPLKVVVAGPPGSGKTHFSQKLAESYGVPHIKVDDIVGFGESLTDAFGQEIKIKLKK